MYLISGRERICNGNNENTKYSTWWSGKCSKMMGLLPMTDGNSDVVIEYEAFSDVP